MLLQLNEIVRDGVELRWDVAAALDGIQHAVANCLHLAVLKSSGQDTALPFDRPFADSFINQEVEYGVIRSGYSASKAGLLWICRFLVGEIICLFEEVIGKRHRLRPSLFPKCSLFRHVSEIVVREETHGREVQTLGQAPHDLRCYLAKPRRAGFIRQQDTEEY